MIHRGGPYGGHYHAYIKDDLKEGRWNLELPETFAADPVEVTPKTSAEPQKEEAKAEEAKQESEEEDEKIDWSKLSKQERKKKAKELKQRQQKKQAA